MSFKIQICDTLSQYDMQKLFLDGIFWQKLTQKFRKLWWHND